MHTPRLRVPAIAAACAIAGIAAVAGPVELATARAGACTGLNGISVVVDPNESGGAITAGCDPDDGRAADNFADAGYVLEYSQAVGMNGFVCKINGAPADGDCTEKTAYWSLWWSDGVSGKWVYSSRGVSSLKVPDGGYVAFAWHQGGGRAAPPDAVPTPRQATATERPTPTSTPDRHGTKGHKGDKGDKGAKSVEGDKAGGASDHSTSSVTPIAPSASVTPSAKPRASTTTSARGASSEATSSAVPGVEDIAAGPETDTGHVDSDNEGGSFPTWIAGGLAVGVLGAAGAVPLIRRRLG